MSHDHSALIAQFREALTQQRYSPVVIHNYCRNADYFLRYLAEREIAVEAATPAQVSNYLRAAVRWFRKRHGYSPAPPWHSVPRAAILIPLNKKTVVKPSEQIGAIVVREALHERVHLG
jgi:integrase/recombinase XerD